MNLSEVWRTAATMLTLVVTSTTVSAKEIPLKEMCEIRSALMGSVAQERDNGKTREEIKKKTPAKFKGLYPWIDLVYDQTQGMKPQEVANLVKYSCLKNRE